MRFNFVRKDQECLLGYLPMYGVYECKLKDVEKNYENNGEDSVYFNWGGYIFEQFSKEPDAYSYLGFKSDNYFIQFIALASNTNTKGYDDMSVHLFDIPVIKKGIENLIKYASKATMENKERQTEDLILLRRLLEKLKFYEAKNVLVSCWLE
jgi:hypothetical protein